MEQLKNSKWNTLSKHQWQIVNHHKRRKAGRKKVDDRQNSQSNERKTTDDTKKWNRIYEVKQKVNDSILLCAEINANYKTNAAGMHEKINSRTENMLFRRRYKI